MVRIDICEGIEPLATMPDGITFLPENNIFLGKNSSRGSLCCICRLEIFCDGFCGLCLRNIDVQNCCNFMYKIEHDFSPVGLLFKLYTYFCSEKYGIYLVTVYGCFVVKNFVLSAL